MFLFVHSNNYTEVFDLIFRGFPFHECDVAFVASRQYVQVPDFSILLVCRHSTPNAVHNTFFARTREIVCFFVTEYVLYKDNSLTLVQ